MIILGSPFMFGAGKLIDVIGSLGLTSGLKLCLDAGDENSYSSGQKWLDVSGNGYDFFRGGSSSSEGSDPTFNGTAGGKSASEYWSFDGGDYFIYDSSNETWMQNLHKNNAAWAFSTWVYLPSVPSVAAVIVADYRANTSFIGFSAFVTLAGLLRVSVGNGGGGAGVLSITTSAAVVVPGWNFLAGQIDEAAGTGFLQINETQVDKTTTYNSPSASSSEFVMQIGRDGASGDAGPLESGTRMHSLSMWESSMPTKAQMLQLYQATSGIFGL